MKTFVTLLFIVTSTFLFSQSTRKIIKDFDGDKKIDTFYIDSDVDKLFSVLSTNNYKKVSSKYIERLNFGNTLVDIKNGVEFWNDFGRSGFIAVFKYNDKAKKMQLAQIRRTDYDLNYSKYGKEVRHGSGKSSINLLTNQYIGDFYAVKDEKLLKLPTIKKEMILPETFLESFSGIFLFKFEEKCVAIYEKAKKETE